MAWEDVKVINSSFDAFKRHVRTPKPKEDDPEDAPKPVSYTTLRKYEKVLNKFIAKTEETEDAKEKALHNKAIKKRGSLETIIRIRAKEGVYAKRRKPGTGRKVVVKRVYADTPNNRTKNRVGQEYEVVRYEDYEEEEYRQRVRLPKRRAKKEGSARPQGIWIRAFSQAKKEFAEEDPSLLKRFLPACKELKNPDDPNEVLRHKITLRAQAIMAEIRKEETAEKAAAAPEAEPMEVEAA
nr:hypothetical protein [Sicyoidochytrium minutum DNA virus]